MQRYQKSTLNLFLSFFANDGIIVMEFKDNNEDNIENSYNDYEKDNSTKKSNINKYWSISFNLLGYELVWNDAFS